MQSTARVASMLESTRDLTIEAAQSANAARSSRSNSRRTTPFAQLKKLLDSRHDREILEGLRKVISMMYRGLPCLPYFSSVVKNVANPNIEVKKLVYIYLLQHAEAEPDLALLSINTIQKSLTDQNPQVRAMALRTMSGIRVPVISQIVSLAIKRGCSDMSPHVRKAAALAIPKCYKLDPNTLPQLLECVSALLGDKQYFVVGPAVSAFMDVCPDRIDLIHKHYRGLVRKLVDMDEWSQISAMKLLLNYSRRCFPVRTRKVTKPVKKGFYEDEVDETEETGQETRILEPDLELFLKACKPLLQSKNAAVIVSVTRCFLYLGTSEYLESAVGPIVALLRGSADVQYIALYDIVSVALVTPASFTRYFSHFLIHSLDTPEIWRLKLELLTIIFPYCGFHTKGLILNELEHFSHSAELELVRESVRAIGRCAQTDRKTSGRCFRILLKQVSGTEDNLVSEALTVIRHLIQQDPTSHRITVIKLAKSLDVTTSPEARATIIWLVGEFAGVDPENNIAADVLRILAKDFADESEVAKQQIVLLGAKVYLHFLQGRQAKQNPEAEASNTPAEEVPPDDLDSSSVSTLYNYILLLARYDTSYDLRDRARLYKSLLSLPSSTQLASLLLLAPKPVPHQPSPSEARRGLLLGSSSLIVGPAEAGFRGLPGYEDLPEWVGDGKEPDSKLRDEQAKAEYGEKKAISASERLEEAARAQGKQEQVRPGKTKTLDDWLDEEEEEETETEEEEEEVEVTDDEVESSEGEYEEVEVEVSTDEDSDVEQQER